MHRTKICATGIAAVAIIYRRSDPSQIFIEVKDDGHPIKLVRRQLCFIGGNWIGENAKTDKNPRETLMRELNEELSFDRPIRNSEELSLLGIAAVEKFAPTPAADDMATHEDRQLLEDLKRTITKSLVPFGDYLNHITKAALDNADPNNKREGFKSLVSYWTAALPEDEWRALRMLQQRFGNLSNESITLFTSLEDILRAGTKIAFGHDNVLRAFFASHGFADAELLITVPHVASKLLSMPLPSYDEYLVRYDVTKTPLAARA